VLARSIVPVNISSAFSAQQFLRKPYTGDQNHFSNAALADAGQTEAFAKIA
jgi:hypothetical protein